MELQEPGHTSSPRLSHTDLRIHRFYEGVSLPDDYRCIPAPPPVPWRKLNAAEPRLSAARVPLDSLSGFTFFRLPVTWLSDRKQLLRTARQVRNAAPH